MPTLPVIAFGLGRAMMLAAFMTQTLGRDGRQLQEADTAAIAAGELAVQCQGDGPLTDHLASLRTQLTRNRERLGRRKVYLDRVKAMDLRRLNEELDAKTYERSRWTTSGDTLALGDFDADLDLLEAATLASIGDRLNPARNGYAAGMQLIESESKAFESGYRHALTNCYRPNGKPFLERDNRFVDDSDASGRAGRNPDRGAAMAQPATPMGTRPAIAATPSATPARNQFDVEEAAPSGALQMTPMSEADTRAMAGVASGGARGAAPSTRLDLESFSGGYNAGSLQFIVNGRANFLDFTGTRPGEQISLRGINCSPEGSSVVCQGLGSSVETERIIQFAGRFTAIRQGGTVTVSMVLNGVTVEPRQTSLVGSGYVDGATLTIVMQRQ